MTDLPTLLAEGLTRAEIAERLGVTTRTVDRRLRALRLGSPLPSPAPPGRPARLPPGVGQGKPPQGRVGPPASPSPLHGAAPSKCDGAAKRNPLPQGGPGQT